MSPLDSAGARFRAAFLSKGRVNPYLAGIPTHLLAHADPALLGLAALISGRIGA